ncbi:MAG: oligosaccharide flippase family protein [Anaerolineae bacterium]|nr:oligosaccharide flippase family protein [Anaerolineae bacterium]
MGLRQVRLRWRWRLRHPALGRILALYAPVMGTLALDVLVNRPFTYNLASRSSAGAISVMEYATTLVQFPHGLVGTAISIAVLPTLARQAGDLARFRDTLGAGLRLAITLILPATVGLIVFAPAVVGLVFQRGAFTPTDAAATAVALQLYLVGLPLPRWTCSSSLPSMPGRIP